MQHICKRDVTFLISIRTRSHENIHEAQFACHCSGRSDFLECERNLKVSDARFTQLSKYEFARVARWSAAVPRFSDTSEANLQ